MIHAARGALTAAAFVLLTGCGGRAPAESASGIETTGSPLSILKGAGICRGGASRPLKTRTVVATFRRYGFLVKATRNKSDCLLAAPGTAYAVTNASFDLAPDESNRINEAQGTLNCTVGQMPLFRRRLQKDLHAPANSPIFHGRKAEAFFSNLNCLLYAGDARQEEQVMRFDRAVTELARSVGASP
jgi:hypothetical protein